MDQNLTDRFEELLESDQTDPEIQYQIGICYLRGEGVEQSGTEAEKWLRRAQAQGHQGAADLLARSEERVDTPMGEITEENLSEWCLQAEDGDAKAQYKVGCYMLEHPELGSQAQAEHYLAQAEKPAWLWPG